MPLLAPAVLSRGLRHIHPRYVTRGYELSGRLRVECGLLVVEVDGPGRGEDPRVDPGEDTAER